MELDVYKLDSVTNERIVISGSFKDKITTNVEIKRGNEKKLINEILPQITNMLGFKPFYHEGGSHIIFKNPKTEEELYCIEWHFAKDIKENIVKEVCKELSITQKELSEILGVPQTTISGWATTKIPRMAELALNLLIENKSLKEKLDIFKKAHKIASEL